MSRDSLTRPRAMPPRRRTRPPPPATRAATPSSRRCLSLCFSNTHPGSLPWVIPRRCWARSSSTRSSQRPLRHQQLSVMLLARTRPIRSRIPHRPPLRRPRPFLRHRMTARWFVQLPRSVHTPTHAQHAAIFEQMQPVIAPAATQAIVLDLSPTDDPVFASSAVLHCARLMRVAASMPR